MATNDLTEGTVLQTDAGVEYLLIREPLEEGGDWKIRKYTSPNTHEGVVYQPTEAIVSGIKQGNFEIVTGDDVNNFNPGKIDKREN